jgi:hypothetical protein
VSARETKSISTRVPRFSLSPSLLSGEEFRTPNKVETTSLFVSSHLTLPADLRVGAARKRKSDSGPTLGATIDVELAPEVAHTFANVKKANRL